MGYGWTAGDFVDMYHKYDTTKLGHMNANVDKVESWVRNLIGPDVYYSISMDTAYQIYHLSGVKQEIAICEEAIYALQSSGQTSDMYGNQAVIALQSQLLDHCNSLRVQVDGALGESLKLIEFPAPLDDVDDVAEIKYYTGTPLTGTGKWTETGTAGLAHLPKLKFVTKDATKAKVKVTVISTSTSFAMSVTGRKFRFEE
jgi:hypothetical protein